MRLAPLLVLLAATAATPAAAQIAVAPLDAGRQLALEFQAQEQQRRSIDLDNQLMALEARLRAEQAIATIREQSARPYISPPYVPGTAPALAGDETPVDTSKLVSIPDDRLAASNAAVRAVTQAPRR